MTVYTQTAAESDMREYMRTLGLTKIDQAGDTNVDLLCEGLQVVITAVLIVTALNEINRNCIGREDAD
jgi:hypothetical protein